jgi:hypothetical protein
MPILKNEKHGRHENATILQFGTGDIAVSNGYTQEDPKVKVVAFGQDKEKEVSEWDKTMPCADTDDLENLVIMTFTRPESIDIIMDRLIKAKAELLNEPEKVEEETED